MPFLSELSSWLSAPKGAPKASPVPQIGDTAPSPQKLGLESSKPAIVAFLRHCGCPFAEKTFLQMRDAAKTHTDIDFIAVSHSNQQSTDNWLKSLPQYGTEPRNLRVVVDDKVEIYAAYGLGPSGLTHVLSYAPLSSVFAVQKEGINVRPTESGSRWQTSGTYAVGSDGRIKYGGPAKRADDMPDFATFVQKLNA